LKVSLSVKSAREWAEEHRGVDAEAVQAHPPRQVLGTGVLADHTGRVAMGTKRSANA
jgi:hypothetical protein